MKLVSPVVLAGIGCLQIVSQVSTDSYRKYQCDADPEGAVEIWIRSYVGYQIVLTAVWNHGPFNSFHDIVRVYVEELLIVLYCPEIAR